MHHLISISGPPASGKTTLWESLRSAGNAQIDFVPDLPREALERLKPSLGAGDDVEFQHYVGYRQLTAEAAPRDADLRICDKSLLDAIAYWDVLFDRPRPRWAAAMTPHRYSLVLLCDHRAISPPDDMVSQLHLAQREALAQAIERNARQIHSPLVRLSGSPRERLAVTLEHLSELSA